MESTQNAGGGVRRGYLKVGTGVGRRVYVVPNVQVSTPNVRPPT